MFLCGIRHWIYKNNTNQPVIIVFVWVHTHRERRLISYITYVYYSYWARIHTSDGMTTFWKAPKNVCSWFPPFYWLCSSNIRFTQKSSASSWFFCWRQCSACPTASPAASRWCSRRQRSSKSDANSPVSVCRRFEVFFIYITLNNH